MRHSLLAAAVLAATLAACQPQAPTAPDGTIASATASQADAQFADLSKRWLDGWLRLNPVSATQIGDHRFDGEIDDLSAAGRAKSLEFSMTSDSRARPSELQVQVAPTTPDGRLPKPITLRASREVQCAEVSRPGRAAVVPW